MNPMAQNMKYCINGCLVPPRPTNWHPFRISTWRALWAAGMTTMPPAENVKTKTADEMWADEYSKWPKGLQPMQLWLSEKTMGKILDFVYSHPTQ